MKLYKTLSTMKLLAVLGIGIITFLLFIQIENMEAEMALRVFLGGMKTNRVVLLTGYIIWISIIQFTTIDGIVYYYNPYNWIRYKKRSELYRNIFLYIGISGVLTTCVLIVSLLIVNALSTGSVLVEEISKVLVTGIRGFIEYITIAVLQTTLYYFYDWVIVNIIINTVAIIFISLVDTCCSVMLPVPVEMSKTETRINICICCIYTLALLYTCKLNDKRGHRRCI